MVLSIVCVSLVVEIPGKVCALQIARTLINDTQISLVEIPRKTDKPSRITEFTFGCC